MITMLDMVSGSLKRLRVVNPRKVIDGISASEGLDALNEMMHAWKGEGVDTDHDTLELTDDFPLDDEHIQGTKALLAIRLSSDYGLEINAGIARDAEMGWAALQAEFIEPAQDAVLDTGLTRTLLGRWGVG